MVIIINNILMALTTYWALFYCTLCILFISIFLTTPWSGHYYFSHLIGYFSMAKGVKGLAHVHLAGKKLSQNSNLDSLAPAHMLLNTKPCTHLLVKWGCMKILLAYCCSIYLKRVKGYIFHQGVPLSVWGESENGVGKLQIQFLSFLWSGTTWRGFYYHLS